MRLTCWHYYAEVPRGHTVIVRGLCPALLLGGPHGRSPGAGAQGGGRTLAHAPAGELIRAPRVRVGRRKVEGRPCGVQERIAGARGRAGRQVPPYTKVEGKLREGEEGSWLLVRWAGPGWASGQRGLPRQVLAPAGVRRHVVTPLWILFPPPPAPRARAAPGAGPLRPRFRRRGLAGAGGSGAAMPAARGVWPGLRGPRAAPGSALGGGAVPQARPPHPGSPERDKSRSRTAQALPGRAGRRALRGPGRGERLAPGQAQLPGAGGNRVFTRIPGTPNTGDRPLEK